MIRAKPFPWKCGQCGARAVERAAIPYSVEIEHDGRAYTVEIPALEAPRCLRCGEIVLDDQANQVISAALRQQIGLLAPAEIRRARESLNLTQKELADLLGIASATLSRWETGSQIQQRSLDRLLRLCFASPTARKSLEDFACARGRAHEQTSEGTGDQSKTNEECSAAPAGKRAQRFARLATELEKLPAEKEAAVVTEFHRLLKLISDAP